MGLTRTVRTVLAVVMAGTASVAPAQEALPQSSPAQAVPPQKPPGTPTQADPALPVYDVSAIRPSGSETEDSHVWGRLNSLEVRNISLIHLLESAFDVPQDMIVGLPEWARHARLDIDAKTLDADTAQLRALTAAQRRAMMRELFEDRLGLKWHLETRVLPSYELLVANGGPKLKPTLEKGTNSGTSVNDTRLSATNIPISGLAMVLSDKLGRPVVDKTGLTGRYDISLVWTAEEAAGSREAAGEPDAPPPLFVAVQEQLGLKLQGAKDPVQVFAIDQLLPPAPN